MEITLCAERVEKTKIAMKEMLSEYVADAEIQNAKYQTLDEVRSLRSSQSSVVATGARPVGSRARRRCYRP